MRLSDLGRERVAQVVYDGEPIEVVYRPAAINSNWLERMSAEDKDASAYTTLLSEALVRWDITDDASKPLAPTPELLRELPIDLLNLIAQALIEGLAPKK
jgi:hypothetical protein